MVQLRQNREVSYFFKNSYFLLVNSYFLLVIFHYYFSREFFALLADSQQRFVVEIFSLEKEVTLLNYVT